MLNLTRAIAARRGLIVFTCLAVTSCVYHDRRRRPSRFLIPEDYVGWVRVNFRVEGAPPLPLEDGHYLFKFPPSGLIETSADMEYGVAVDYFYYYCGETKRRLESTTWGGGGVIWVATTGWSGSNFAERTNVNLEFFVGTEEELEKYEAARSKNLVPQTGPLQVKELPCAE